MNPAAAAHVLRGGMVECTHYADLVVVDTEGTIQASFGDPHLVFYLRSAAKPLQAVTVLNTGAAERFGLEPDEVAVICASHSAAAMHLAAVRSILRKIGLEETALQCGVHAPEDPETAESLRAAGQSPGPIHNNCSGKHAGMLAACLCLGADVETYLSLEHPVQQANLATICRLSGAAPEEVRVGIDGCGVPTWGISLAQAARAFSRLARPEAAAPEDRAALQAISWAMRQHPALVSHEGSFHAELMAQSEGDFVVKGGAEGSICLACRRAGWGLAMKVRDGSTRAQPTIVLEALRQLELLSPPSFQRLARFFRPAVTNARNEVVGEIVPAFEWTTRRTTANGE